MQFMDFQKEFEKRFRDFLKEMEKEDINLAEKGKEKLKARIYRKSKNKINPLKKVSFLTLENGWVKNKDDKNLLDECELTAVSFIPEDEIPLPILALESSIHLGKYDHLNVDLFPLSKDKRYKEIFSEPVKVLRKKNENLPGLLPGVRMPSLLDEYSSGGMVAGDFNVSLRDKTLPWFFEYTDLYKGFLENVEKFPILKEEAIIEEAKKTRELFLSTFRKASPRILSDIPNLYDEETGRKLGGLLF